MPDNIQITEGSGKTVATDDVSGVQYQVIKIAVGADGVANYMSASNPVPVSTDATTQGLIGALTETAPASDTASSGLNGRLQRLAQRITSVIALLPSALGTRSAATSLAVALSTEDAAKVPALGANTAANSTPVTLANDGIFANVTGTAADAAITTNATGTLSGKLRGLIAILADVWDSVNHRLKIDGSAVTQPVSASSLPLPSGAAVASKQPALGTAGTPSADVISVQGVASGTAIPASQSGTWTVQPGNTANTTPWLMKTQRATTPTQSSVAGSASSVSLLAANSSRLGATIYNDSSSVLSIKLGATASATSFSALLAGNGSGIGGSYEVPFGYTGAIDGIWASATGNARITELT